MKTLALLAGLFPVLALGAVTFPDAESLFETFASEDPATNNLSHTVSSGTDLLLCGVAHLASEGAASVTWNGNSMTKVSDLEASTNGGDAGGSLWGLISPSAATGDFAVTGDDTSWSNWHIKWCLNVAGNDTTNVATAISAQSNDENSTATNQCVHASAGSAGNKMLLYGVGIGGDMVPASNDVTATEIREEGTGGGTGNGNDGSVYIAEKDAASSITVTWAQTDENVCTWYEITAASSGGATVQRRRRQ